MKNILIVLLSTVSLIVHAQTKFEEPIAYNDFIVEEQTKIGEQILAFMDEFSAGTYESTMAKHAELLAQIKSSIQAIDHLDAFKGNTRLKTASLSLFKFYLSICEKEYARMAELLFSEDYSEDDQKELMRLADEVAAKEVAYDSEFELAQTEFANEHGISLEENILQDEFDGSEE